MKLGIDCDGVLADWNTSFIRRTIEVTGKDLFGPDFIPREWEYPTAVGYTEDDLRAVHDSIVSDASFWRGLEQYHGEKVIQALAALDLYQARGEGEVYFITNRFGYLTKWQTEKWLKSHAMSDPTVLITTHKGLTAKALNLDAYIDDKLENIEDVVTHTGITCMPFLCDRPWNQAPRDFIDTHEIPVVKSVWEMLDQLHMVE